MGYSYRGVHRVGGKGVGLKLVNNPVHAPDDSYVSTRGDVSK